jgi:diguanylate cyclase (GGDEF)-like protein
MRGSYTIRQRPGSLYNFARMMKMGASLKIEVGKVPNGVLFASTLALLLFGVWIISPFYDPKLVDPISSLGLIVISLITAGFGFNIASNKTFFLPVRRAWTFFAIGSLSGAIAETIWFYYYYILVTNPSISVADLFYLLTFPLILLGILSLPYASLNREQRLLLNVDMVIVVLVAALFLWHFVLVDLIKQGVRGLPGLVSIAYPIADLVILSGLVSLLQQTIRGIGRMIVLFFALGIGLSILADILFAAYKTFNVSEGSAPLDLLWLVSRWAILVAAIWQTNQTKVEEKQSESFSPLLRTNLLYIAVLLGMGLAFFELESVLQSNLNLYGTLFGAFGITVLVLVRQYIFLQDNRRLHEELEHLATSDPLTGIANRRFFEETLAREIKRAQRYQRQLSLLMIDIDNFKNYNDQHGHPMGDKLLQDCAHLFRALLRDSDLVARYGGDEFVVILPEISVEQGKFVADKLRKIKIGTLASEEEIAISIGCAAFQQDMTAASLLELADQDLYRQKPDTAGR